MLTRRKRKRRARAPLALLPVLAAAAAAAAGLVVRRRRSASATAAGPFTTPAPPSEAPAAAEVEHTWSCVCGQEYRVSGEGRHRVYWPADASVSDPVMAGRCVNCDRPLPGEQPEPGPEAA